MSKILQKQLGKQIQKLRKERGYSQEKFAEKIGIATTSLSYIETGNGFLTSDTLEKICTVLSIEPYELFLFNERFNNISPTSMYDFISDKLFTLKQYPDKLKEVYIYFKSL